MDHILTFVDNIEFIDQAVTRESIIEKTGFQTFLEREVTIRYLRADLADDPRQRFQFMKDARAMGSLRHPNIACVYDAGIVNNNVPYLVVEKPGGVTLEHEISRLADRWRQMNSSEMLSIFNHIADAVEYLHQQRVSLHNLLPDDIFRTKTGQTILTSLGQPVRPNVLSATPTALSYTAPERLLDRPGQDERCDIYSLGVLIYHMMFGRLPFYGDQLQIVGQKQHANSLPALDDDQIDLPCSEVMKQVLRQATAAQPDLRYPSVAALRTDVLNVLGSHPATPLVRPVVQHDSKFGLNGVSARAADGEALNGNVMIFDHLAATGYGHSPTALHSNGVAAGQGYDHTNVASDTGYVRPNIDHLPRASADDPLLPGRTNPALQSALPYTILVPIPDQPAAEGDTINKETAPTPVSSSKHGWLVVSASVLVLMGALTATILG
jgi:serine/threonine protein kinase